MQIAKAYVHCDWLCKIWGPLLYVQPKWICFWKRHRARRPEHHRAHSQCPFGVHWQALPKSTGLSLQTLHWTTCSTSYMLFHGQDGCRLCHLLWDVRRCRKLWPSPMQMLVWVSFKTSCMLTSSRCNNARRRHKTSRWTLGTTLSRTCNRHPVVATPNVACDVDPDTVWGGIIADMEYCLPRWKTTGIIKVCDIGTRGLKT